MLLAGVGGQGVLLAGEVLARAALQAGFDVKKSEVHGMAQRGGVVVSHVRYGEKVHSPLIPRGVADVLLAFEELEALRWHHYLKPDGTLLVSEERLIPPSAFSGGEGYPKEPLTLIKSGELKVLRIGASGLAREIGNPRVMSAILLGALSILLDIDAGHWRDALRALVPKGTEEVNLLAFEKGKQSLEISNN